MLRDARSHYFPRTSATSPPTTVPSTVQGPAVEPTSEPEGQLLKDGFEEYGRFYGSWRRGKYLLPIDQEELERLDIFHEFFRIARRGRICSVDLRKEGHPKVLDLGTGTGIWAFSVVEDFYKNAEVMAVDINLIQPYLIPQSVTTMQFDIEEPSWNPLFRDCELIHLRSLYGSIADGIWPRIYRNVFEHLVPREGHVEHVEIDWEPRWEGGSAPAKSAYRDWYQTLQVAMNRSKRSIEISSQHTQQMMEAAGLIDFTEIMIQCHMNPWATDHRKEATLWFNKVVCEGLEAMSMAPLIQQLGMKEADVRDLCERVREEICRLRNGDIFCTMYIWTATKPLPPTSVRAI
ncbi:methyltransferase LAE1 [Trichoderma sp. SZMC 28013]